VIDIKLETFITVADTKNFTRAASILNMTQPAISHHIKLLEEYYNVKLLENKNKNMELTEAGRILYKYALEIENTGNIIQKLFSGEIILGVIEGPFDKSKVIYEKFKDDELVFAISKSHEMAKKKKITMDEILSEKLILREKGSGTRQIFEDYMVQQGFEPKNINPYMEIGDITAIMSLVESGLGATVVSKEALNSPLMCKKFKALSIKNMKMKREFNFIYLKNSNMDFIKNFIDFCKKQCDETELE